MSQQFAGGMRRIRERYNQLGDELSSPEVLADPSKISAIAKERAELEPKVEAFETWEKLGRQYRETCDLLDEETDSELVEMAKSEAEELEGKIERLEEKLKIMLIPEDPLDKKDCIMEIRAGTGGEEAALFAGDLYRMYTHFADGNGWKTEILSMAPSEKGGFKEVIFSVAGTNVFSTLKYESGVHRVQRVPETETSGRIHTSAATVVVMPEAEDVNIDLNPHDLKIDVYRSSGPGGQSVNTTDSAVRITHEPTGLVVTCQDEKSQHKNKAKALKVLRARLLDQALEKQQKERTRTRRSMVSTGDRSAKIRTYNFPQNRVTDHRINLTLYRLEEILSGDLGEMIEAIRFEDRAKALEEQAEQQVESGG